MAKDKVSYIGLFLSTVVREELLRRVKPTHSIVHATHITLVFNPDANTLDRARSLVGKKFLVDIVGYARDEKGEAVIVRKDTLPFECKNEIAHITIGCAEGVKPFYSNELLKELGAKEGQFVTVFPDVVSCASFKRFTIEVMFDMYPRTIPDTASAEVV